MYTFYLQAERREVPSLYVADCLDDETAVLHARRELSESRTASRIEVMLGDRDVARLSR